MCKEIHVHAYDVIITSSVNSCTYMYMHYEGIGVAMGVAICRWVELTFSL